MLDDAPGQHLGRVVRRGLLAVPAGIEYFDAIATMIGGSLVLRTSMLFGVAFFVQFLIGGLSGIFIASPVLDYHVEDSYVIVAHFHYTLFAGSVFGFFAGAYHWFPKLTGALSVFLTRPVVARRSSASIRASSSSNPNGFAT